MEDQARRTSRFASFPINGRFLPKTKQSPPKKEISPFTLIIWAIFVLSSGHNNTSKRPRRKNYEQFFSSLLDNTNAIRRTLIRTHFHRECTSSHLTRGPLFLLDYQWKINYKKYNIMKPYPFFFCFICLIFVTTTTAAQGSFFTLHTLPQATAISFESLDTIHYVPVCGDNGKSYINTALAKADGIDSWTAGECSAYAQPAALDPSQLWISSVGINDWAENSAFDSNGYVDNTNIIFEIAAEHENRVDLQSELLNGECSLQWTIWIDFNENHQFEASEQVFQSKEEIVNGALQLPTGIKTEIITRMRISLTPVADANTLVTELTTGEIEDYSIYITQ